MEYRERYYAQKIKRDGSSEMTLLRYWSMETRETVLKVVKKLYWMSKATEKPEGSMAVYFDSWAVAQQVVAEKDFKVGPSLATAREYVPQEQPVRCYNCNRYRHTQAK